MGWQVGEGWTYGVPGVIAMDCGQGIEDVSVNRMGELRGRVRRSFGEVERVALDCDVLTKAKSAESASTVKRSLR